ncbi:hypothetical protein ACWFRJ_39680 [Streptomyces sp. NPDC055239]
MTSAIANSCSPSHRTRSNPWPGHGARRSNSTITSRSPLNRPAHLSDADWAEYQHCQAEHDSLVAQVADREAHMEHDLIVSYDEYELDFSPVPEQEADPARRTPPPHRTPASRRRTRGR